MKHKVFIIATIMMALIIPQTVSAYDFSAVAPSGQTLYYNIVNGEAQVTSQNGSYPFYSTCPSGVLTIPSSVSYNGTTYTISSIGDYAFYNCTNLTSATIPNGVTSIGGWAFSGCNALTSVSIPSGVTLINTGAFQYCSSLTSLIIPNGVTSIGYCVFSNCSGLTSVTIPNSVTSIDYHAFEYCSGLTSVIIPNSVTSIGDGVFSNCTGLTAINIPNSITSIGENAFGNCSNLTSIAVDNGNTVYDSRQNCNAIIETATNTLITGCMNTTIPNTVTSIGNFAFNYCSGLTFIIIPNSVTSIGFAAFGHCNGLTSVSIPNSVNSIGEHAFLFCSSLTSVTIQDGVTSIGPSAFEHCNNLTTISIPNSVISIGATAFRECNSLTSVTLPAGITSIENYTFNNCSSLTSITIPTGVTSIGWQAFKNCISLDTVFMMPLEAPSLGSDAFYNNAPGRVFILYGCSYDNYYNNSSWTSFRNYLREAIININLNLSTNDYTFGMVNVIPGPGNRIIRCDSSVVIQATNNYGYFDHWSTGSTTNPDTIYLAGDSTVTAYFIGLTVLSSDSERGSASHMKIGDHMDRIIATPNYGYHFDHWSNGSTANPDTIHFEGDSTVIAFFERNTYHLTAEVNDASLGSVSMPLGDSALYQDTLMVVASPIEHYHVSGWYGMDIVGISANKDTVWVRMTNNCIITCNFVINYYTVNVSTNDIVRGMVESNGTQFAYGTPCTVTATAYTGYTFYGWSNGVTANPYTFAVVGDVELTALFVADGEDVYTVTVVSADPAMGNVSGGGQAVSGGTVTIRATPNEGYRFLNWQDGNTENPRTVTVTSDITYTAYFESTTQGIFNVDENKIMAYPNPTSGIINVTADDVLRIAVYNVNSQLVKTALKESVIDISALPSGVYTLRVETIQSTFVCRVIKQ